MCLASSPCAFFGTERMRTVPLGRPYENSWEAADSLLKIGPVASSNVPTRQDVGSNIRIPFPHHRTSARPFQDITQSCTIAWMIPGPRSLPLPFPQWYGLWTQPRPTNTASIHRVRAVPGPRKCPRWLLAKVFILVTVVAFGSRSLQHISEFQHCQQSYGWRELGSASS